MFRGGVVLCTANFLYYLRQLYKLRKTVWGVGIFCVHVIVVCMYLSGACERLILPKSMPRKTMRKHCQCMSGDNMHLRLARTIHTYVYTAYMYIIYNI
jgi:putative copper export protein